LIFSKLKLDEPSWFLWTPEPMINFVLLGTWMFFMGEWGWVAVDSMDKDIGRDRILGAEGKGGVDGGGRRTG
jgi:hypothetical protein